MLLLSCCIPTVLQTVQLRLMGATNPESEGRRTPRLLARKDSLNWQLLATAPLPLGQLAPNTASDQDLGDASTFASSSATPVSTRGSSMDQATISQLPGMGGSSATGSSAFATAGSSTAAMTSTPEGGRTATSPFRVMSGADEDDDAGSDSGQLFSTDSLAAAAASLVAHQLQQKQQQDEQRGENSTVSLCGWSPGKGRRSSGEEPATGAGASQVAGLWVAGDSQVTRLTLQWEVTSGSTESEVAVLEQEVSKSWHQCMPASTQRQFAKQPCLPCTMHVSWTGPASHSIMHTSGRPSTRALQVCIGATACVLVLYVGIAAHILNITG